MARFTKGQEVMQILATQGEFIPQAAEALTRLASAGVEQRKELNSALHTIENKADVAGHTFLATMSRAFVLPYDRADLYDISSSIDDCVDLIDEAGDNMYLSQIGEMPPRFHEMIDIICKCATLTADAIVQLQKLSPGIRDFWVAINELENQGDKIYRQMIADMFSSDLDAKDVLRYKFILDTLEATIDKFESLAALIETVAIKES